ncbi:hypothetical protein [Ferroplasma sp.]|uniref:hypothetical protein n=1 Tax=Ferroplasma sp. TaxID=2591003 RepID=UPI00307CF4AF
MITIIVVAMFVMVSFSGVTDKRDLSDVNQNPDDNYVKIGNLTFMHNFVIENNGIVLSKNINRTAVNNINSNYNKNINTTNNSLMPVSYNYIKTNNTNYLIEKYNLTSKNDILYTLAFTDNFTKYKVEIGTIIIDKNNKNISEIYANIVPKNSSKILYGNEFTVNYKASYYNEMKSLINSIHLTGLYYMNSNNITLDKFGNENNYIAMAINNMLDKTNNTVNSINVSEINAIIVDDSILSWIGLILLVAGFILLMLTGPPGWVFDVAMIISDTSVILAFYHQVTHYTPKHPDMGVEHRFW